MRVFRIERKKYLNTTLTGAGAAMSEGNRWNSLGTKMIYTSGTLSLAILEVAVHLDLSEDLPQDRHVVEIDIPDTAKVFALDIDVLPQSWNDKPPTIDTQFIGDDFVNVSQDAVLSVPSSIVPLEFNFLINPARLGESSIKVIKTYPFIFDERLSK